jgi:hypothetical protein
MDDLFGTSQGTIQTQGSTEPWAQAQPYLLDVFSKAQGLYNNSPTSMATRLQQQRALDQNGLTAQAQRGLGDTISGKYLNPGTNPAFAAGLNDALGMAKSQFAGQYGGAAGQNLGNSGYQEALARGLGGVASQAYSNLYNTERGNQMAALSMAPGLDYANIAALYQSGNAPWNDLARYQQAITVPFNQTSGQQPYYTNNTANTLGTLATAGALYFSDRRLKSNIVKVGDHPKGFGIYEYDIFGVRQRGVMADEVEKVMPHAVVEIDGYKAVNYGLL